MTANYFGCRIRPYRKLHGSAGLIAVLAVTLWVWPQDLWAGGRNGPRHSLAVAAEATKKKPAKDLADGLPATAKPKSYSGYTVIGAAELVTIYPQKIQVRAKVDTGAKSSSIDAEFVENFSRDGDDWVRVRIFGEDNTTHEVELRIVRWVRIRRAGVPLERRAIVMMNVCLGSIRTDVEVNLAERTKLNHRMLLGRDLLKGRFLVDPGSRYLTRPTCNDRKAK